MDYLRYWSLLRKPFLFPQGDDFFAGAPQREALAGLSYLVGCEDKLAMLVCPRQNGLSWMLAYATQMRGFGDRATELITTRGDHGDHRKTVAELCKAMTGGSVCSDATSPDDHQQIDRAIETLQQQEVQLVWLLDRCQPAAAELANQIANRHDNLSIVLGTSPQVAQQTILRLGKYPMQIDLLALTVDDTCDYVRYCLQRAGGDPAMISDNTSVRLHEITAGVIGQLAVAVESSLAVAANHQLECVTTAAVEAVAERIQKAA